jgi:hypothetical protein
MRWPSSELWLIVVAIAALVAALAVVALIMIGWL